MVTCGATSGPNAPVDIRPFYARQHSVLGSFMGGRAELLRVLELVEAGKLRPIVDRVFPLKEAAVAHRYMEERRQFGKIVLAV